MKKPFDDVKNTHIVVYTVITGGYDALPEPEVIDENCSYVCFTDSIPKKTEGVWQYRKLVSPEGLDPIRAQRYHKILAHRLFTEETYSI